MSAREGRKFWGEEVREGTPFRPLEEEDTGPM